MRLVHGTSMLMNVDESGATRRRLTISIKPRVHLGSHQSETEGPPEVNMENVSNDSSCPASEAIASTAAFSALLNLEAIIGLLSVGPNLLLTYVVFRAVIYPSNLRYLLAHLSLNIAWYSLGSAIKAFDTLTRSTCRLEMTAYNCRLTELPLTIPAGNIFYSLMGVCLERLYCSVRYRTYEKESARPWLACLFLSIIWTGSVASNLYSIPFIPKDKTVPICESILSIGSIDALTSLTRSLVLEVIALLIIVSASWWDHRKLCHSAVNRAKFNLAERFQISQCVQVNTMLVPSVILHGVCFLPFMVVMVLVAYGLPMTIDVKWSLLHLGVVYRILYCLIHPLVAFGRNARLRQHVLKNAPEFLTNMRNQWRKPSQPGHRNQSNLAAHFNVLEGFWATPSEKGAKAKLQAQKPV